ncbi:response regulator (plasmid) [Phyllobacterium sp. 628]|uniref:response regulator transcription factor n=1 Tax=Phyllobacterium sp. 628 TaxID=2718938 RepID=UPI00166280B8|nr:response regulator [Phyllobacterium sp. 628]QND54807.1 response regulator [Phyllobacterium sp. 628]
MSEPKSIAIVDDDMSVREATENLVRSYGLSVRTFASAESYLAATAGSRIDCLITDIQMDGIDGVELFQTLRQGGVTTPIIFITAFPDERVRKRVMAAGAIGFLGKPFASQALIDCIELALVA